MQVRIIKISILFFIISSLVSCIEMPEKELIIDPEELVKNPKKFIHSLDEGSMETVIIDGCQYLIYKEAMGSNLGHGYMAHKGNCNNPIHIYNSPETKVDSSEIPEIEG